MVNTRSSRKTKDSYTIKATNEIIRVGDCVLLRTSQASKPIVALVEKIEEDSLNNLSVYVRRYYRTEEAIGGRRCFHGKRYCICLMPYNPDKLMVQCRKCKEWYHPECVDMTLDEARRVDDIVCPECPPDDVKVKKPRAGRSSDGKVR